MITSNLPATDFRVSPAVHEFLQRDHKLLIGGEWHSARSGKRIDVICPTTAERLTQVCSGGAEDIDAAVRAARQAFVHSSWAGLKPNARARLLWRIADLIEANADYLAELEYLDTGKPLLHARRGDIGGAAEAFRYYAGWCARIYGKTMDVSRPGAFHVYTTKEPVGVAGLIVPWNFPLLMASWKLAPALAAGCTCVLKPAEETPLTTLALGDLLTEAGLPPGVVNIITGDGATAGAALAAHPDVDKVAFTGSTEVGKLIVNAATGNLKKLSLELGGKSPTLVLPDANLDRAIVGAADGIFHNAGQICAAGSRLYVHRSVFERVVEGICARAKSIAVGPGHLPQTQMGPLVSERHWKRVSRYVQSGRDDGATVLTGGAIDGAKGYFFSPTVITRTTPSMAVVREEIFGPVLVAEAYEDLDEVIAVANDSPYGLTAKLWTRNVSLAHTLARRLEAGSISINSSAGPDPNVPFGGYKQSGWGRELGEEGLNLFLQTKTVLIELGD